MTVAAYTPPPVAAAAAASQPPPRDWAISFVVVVAQQLVVLVVVVVPADGLRGEGRSAVLHIRHPLMLAAADVDAREKTAELERILVVVVAVVAAASWTPDELVAVSWVHVGV